MKNIIKVSLYLLVVTMSSLNAAPEAAPVKPKVQPLSNIMISVPSTYGQDSNIY